MALSINQITGTHAQYCKQGELYSKKPRGGRHGGHASEGGESEYHPISLRIIPNRWLKSFVVCGLTSPLNINFGMVGSE